MNRQLATTSGCELRRARLRKVPSLHSRMIADAQEIGGLIAAEIGIKPGIGPNQLAYEIAQNWCMVAIIIKDKDFPVRYACAYGAGDPTTAKIFISAGFDFDQQYTVLLHECVHVMLHSERFERLNDEYPQLASYPRKGFHELVVRDVERRFVEIGGGACREDWEYTHLN